MIWSLDIVSFIFSSIVLFYAIVNPEIHFQSANFGVRTLKLNYRLKLLCFLTSLISVLLALYVFYNPSKQSEEKSFSNPIYRDYRLDNCLYEQGRGCGLEAAVKWCRAQGFKTAVDYNVQNISKIGMQTKRFGDDFVCSRGDICAGFTFIQCSK